MECNKDEAVRAKDIAVRKFTEGNVAGAKKFALKAQTLYPGIEGITQMIAALEVYISAENKRNGEIDMYGILGVSANADDETIKKQYRKLLLQLHPDKNKFIGADGAFQRVSEAFNLLSDKAKRAAYNGRCNIRTAHSRVPSQSSSPTWPNGFETFQPKIPKHFGVSVPPCSNRRTADQKVPTQKGVFGSSNSSQQKLPTQNGSSPFSWAKAFRKTSNSTKQSGAKGIRNTSSSTSSRGKATKNTKSKKPSPPFQAFQPFPKNDDTFWTKCNGCMMQYEYIRVYLNQLLLCPNCKEAFEATEVPPPSNLSAIPPQQHQKAPSSSGSRNSGHNNLFTDSGKRANDDDPSYGLNGDGPTKRTREMDDRVKDYSGAIPSESAGIGTGEPTWVC